MKVLDPGHTYLLNVLDGDPGETVRITHVKRVGDNYPGNEGPHRGTTTQEVLRAEYDRLRHVNTQKPCMETAVAASQVAYAIHQLENRAARLHGRPDVTLQEAVYGELCPTCGHTGCNQTCRGDNAESSRS